MKSIVVALAIFTCGAVARDAAALTIRGAVVKGGDRKPVAGQTVQLHLVRGEEELKGASSVTNDRGEYEFAGLAGDPSIQYYISTEYEDAFYTEGPFSGDQSPTVSHDFTVYDVGNEISTVQVKNHHIILERKTDAFHVTEILIFENTGTKAYLGSGPDHAERVGARVGLPASIDGFKPGMGSDAQTTRVKGRELSSDRPIPPGIRPFSFTYTIPLSGRVDLSHRLYYPTASFVVLLDDPKLRIEAKALEFGGTKDQGGKQYAVYSGASFKVGQEIPMRIGGAGFWSNPKVYPWLAAPFLIAAALWFAARRGRRMRDAAHAMPAPARKAIAGTLPLAHPPSAPTSDTDFKKAYLHLIAALDEGLERGEYTRETHGLIRSNLKRRLQALLAEEPASGVR